MSNCRTCDKLRVPDGSQLSIQLERAPSRAAYMDFCSAFPQERYCHCQYHAQGFAAYMTLPQTIVLAQPQASSSNAPISAPSPSEPVCPPVLTAAEEFVVPEVDALANMAVDCTDQYAVGFYVIFPGRGYGRVAAIDASIKMLTLRNETMQPGLRILQGTRLYVLADIEDLFLSWLTKQFDHPETSMAGGQFLAFLPSNQIKAIAAPPGTMLIGGEEGWQIVERSGNLILPTSQSRANLTASGRITPTPPTTELTVKRVHVSMILRNAATDVSQTFTVDEETIEVPKGSAVGISRCINYNGAGSFPIDVPAENGSVTNIRITGFEASL